MNAACSESARDKINQVPSPRAATLQPHRYLLIGIPSPSINKQSRLLSKILLG
jgi:hypothetical protein